METELSKLKLNETVWPRIVITSNLHQSDVVNGSAAIASVRVVKSKIIQGGILACAAMLATAILLPQCLCDASAKTNKSKSCIVIGPAVFLSCKRFQFVPADPFDDLKECGLNDNEKNFEDVRTWFIHNVYAKINDSTPIYKEKPGYYLLLFSQPFPLPLPEGDHGRFMLLHVALTPETLGPNYLKKIRELHQLISSHDQSASPQF